MKKYNDIARAKANLILSSPFFGALALRLKVIETRRIPTAAVDGYRLWYNPDFVASLEPAAVKGLVAHEVMHCALGHHTRVGDREPSKANAAMDYAINLLITDAGFTLPEGGRLDEQYRGMNFEKIYDLLPDPPKMPASGGGGEGDDGEGDGEPGGADAAPVKACAGDQTGTGVVIAPRHADGRECTAGELKQSADEWKVATAQAARQAKAAGKLPGGFEEIITELVAPKEDWRLVLRRFMDTKARDDYSWSVPNRRMLSHGMYLPGMESQRLGEIVLAVDTSGSITSDLLTQFCGEINAILEDVRPTRVHVVYCDTQVNGHDEFEPDDFPVPLHAKGRGGTMFGPVFDWVNETAIAPVAMIYFTDMWAADLDEVQAPDYPVLFADYDGTLDDARVPEFGERLIVD